MAQAKPKANSIVTTVHDTTARTTTYNVVGLGRPPIVLFYDRLSPEVAAHAPYHGMGQRVVDAAAIKAEPPPKGAAADVVARMTTARLVEKYEGMAAIVEHYNSGAVEWAMRGGPTGPRPLDAILVSAVGEVTGKDRETVLAMLAKGAERYGISAGAYLSKLATDSKAVAAAADRLRAAKVTVEFDADEELAGFEEE